MNYFYDVNNFLLYKEKKINYLLKYGKRLISGYTQNFPEPIARIPES